MTTDLRELAAVTALNAMMAKGWMDICTIRSVAEMLGRDPRGDAFGILHSLHCIHFDKMPPALRDAIPALIEQCLDCAPTHRFTIDDAEFWKEEARQCAQDAASCRDCGHRIGSESK